MLSRQDSILSSSSRRRETPTHPPNHRHNHHAAKSIGCMSGIFHLLSKYQNRRKFLTLGKKQEKRDATNKRREKEESRDVRRRFSCGIVQRSPIIPPDVRRSASVKSPENFRSSMALVPRLMGLQEVPAGGNRPVTEYYYSTSSNSSSSSEKRRKLMSDIDKCNEDLKELKDIIQTVQFARHIGRSLPRRPPPAELKRVVNLAKGEGEDDGNVNIPTNEQPSPVSVFDELTRSALISTACTRRQTTQGRILPLPQAQKATHERKKPGEDDAFDSSFFHKVTVKSLQAKREVAPPWSSKAMVESVEEVCKDINAWGEKREVGRIGLVIHDYICRDLIEEVVKEYLGFCYTKYSLPLQACKRRLGFS